MTRRPRNDIQPVKEQNKKTHNRPPHKVPGKILRVLILRRRHVSLSIVVPHALMFAQSFDENQ
jgi:hypothetical protein